MLHVVQYVGRGYPCVPYLFNNKEDAGRKFEQLLVDIHKFRRRNPGESWEEYDDAYAYARFGLTTDLRCIEEHLVNTDDYVQWWRGVWVDCGD